MPLEPSCSCAIENSSGVENARKANHGRLFAHASNLKVQPAFSQAAFNLHFAPAPLSLSFSDRYEKDCSSDDSGADQLIAGRTKAYLPWLIVLSLIHI